MSTTHPITKQTFTNPVNGPTHPNDAAPLADGLDTIASLEDQNGYTGDVRSAGGSHTAQLKELLARATVSSTAPTSPVTNDTWLDTSATPYVLKAWDGAAWQEVAGMAFATPAVVLGTAAAAGSATTAVRSDATVVAFDATAPTTQAIGDSAVVGTVAKAARRDHKHAMPAFGTGSTNVTAGNDSRLSDSRTPSGSAGGDVGGTYPTSLTVPYLPRLTRVATDVAYAATTTLASVTGLGQTVTGGATYALEAHLYVTADVTGGQKYALGGSATATALVLDVVIGDLTTPGATAGRVTTLGTAVALAGSGDTVYQVTLRGTITVNAGGTLTAQAAQNSASGTTTVLRGSTFTLTPVA